MRRSEPRRGKPGGTNGTRLHPYYTVTTQGLRPYGPAFARTYPPGFVVVRLNPQADSDVGGSASPIVSAHHHSAPVPIADDGAPDLIANDSCSVGLSRYLCFLQQFFRVEGRMHRFRTRSRFRCPYCPISLSPYSPISLFPYLPQGLRPYGPGFARTYPHGPMAPWLCRGSSESASGFRRGRIGFVDCIRPPPLDASPHRRRWGPGSYCQ